MEKVQKNINILNRLKFLGVLLGAIMYLATEQAFGEVVAGILGFAFGVAFIVLCEITNKRQLREVVTKDIVNVLKKKGAKEIAFEIKYLRKLIYLRVYLINPIEDISFYKSMVKRRIENSWYKKHVFGAQVVEISNHGEIKDMSILLDEELIKELKHRK